MKSLNFEAVIGDSGDWQVWTPDFIHGGCIGIGDSNAAALQDAMETLAGTIPALAIAKALLLLAPALSELDAELERVSKQDK